LFLGGKIMLRVFVTAVCAAVLSVVATSPAKAQVQAPFPSSTYVRCDGYGAPTREGDGMTKYANSLAIFNIPGNGNTLRHLDDVQSADVVDCTQALAGLAPEHWMRRASLLLARAMHALEGGKTSDALADLDRAEALSKDHPDVFYGRSLGLDIQLVRAYALRVSDDAAGAIALADRAVAERPYSRSASGVAVLAAGLSDQADGQESLLKGQARLNPAGLDLLYQHQLSAGRYAEAVLLFPQLVPPRTFDQSRTAPQQAEDNRATAELFWAVRGGEQAYALAALGRAAEARAAVDAAKTRLERAAAPPPEPSGQESNSQKGLRLFAANTGLRIRALGQPALDQWATLVELRLMVSDHHADEVVRSLPAKRPIRSWATVELFEAIAANSPSQSAAATAAAQTLRAQLKTTQPNARQQDLQSIWKSMPEAESPERRPPYAPGSTPLMVFNAQIKNEITNQGQGYRSLPGEQPGVVAVRYRGLKGTVAMTEEMALLRAAELAREAGKKGFIVLDQRSIVFTVTRTMYAQPLRTDPNGFETEVDVVFVDPDTLPAPFSDSPWRVIDAEDVIARLRPIYAAASTSL
jgi:hypothetical protein